MDIFGINKLSKDIQEWHKRRYKLRDEVFQTVKNSQKFMFELLGKENSKEYWEWRLDFDKKRYRIK